jgi:hypothetical protein
MALWSRLSLLRIVKGFCKYSQPQARDLWSFLTILIWFKWWSLLGFYNMEYCVFSDFPKDSATDGPHLKEIQSYKTRWRSSETPEKPKTTHSVKTQNLTSSINDCHGETWELKNKKVAWAYKIGLFVNKLWPRRNHPPPPPKTNSAYNRMLRSLKIVYSEDKIWAQNILQRRYRFITPTSETQKKMADYCIKFLLHIFKKFMLITRNIQNILVEIWSEESN